MWESEEAACGLLGIVLVAGREVDDDLGDRDLVIGELTRLTEADLPSRDQLDASVLVEYQAALGAATSAPQLDGYLTTSHHDSDEGTCRGCAAGRASGVRLRDQLHLTGASR